MYNSRILSRLCSENSVLLRVHNEGPLLFENAREMHQSSSGGSADASGQSPTSVTPLAKPVYIPYSLALPCRRLRNVSARNSTVDVFKVAWRRGRRYKTQLLASSADCRRYIYWPFITVYTHQILLCTVCFFQFSQDSIFFYFIFF